jgi:hypothetical protein
MYGEQEVLKYIKNERNAAIQSDMTKYALKLLKYSAYKNKSETFLDIGCGCAYIIAPAISGLREWPPFKFFIPNLLISSVIKKSECIIYEI